MLTGNALAYKVNNKISTSEIIDTLKTPLKLHRKWLLKYIVLPMARRAVAMREETKSVIILAFDLSRKALWRLADKMHFEGLIPEPDLIFHMTVDEIDLYLKTRNPILITKAKQRKKLYFIMDKWKFDEIVKGYDFMPRDVSYFRKNISLFESMTD
jgi:pyruvate,water dikinase